METRTHSPQVKHRLRGSAWKTSVGQCECLQMTEHRGTSFIHSCVKVPVDPCSRQPTPFYERPKCTRAKEKTTSPSGKSPRPRFQVERASFDKLRTRIDNKCCTDLDSAREDYNSFIEFIESIPDYMEVHHLSNEQFKQKLDYLKRKQRLLLKNLRNCLEEDDDEETTSKRTTSAVSSDRNCRSSKLTASEKCSASPEIDSETGLMLKGKRCNLEESRTNSPLLFSSSSFSCLADDQDLLTYRCKGYKKAEKTRRNEEILSASKAWSSGSESKSGESLESDDQEITVETKSLPSHSPKRWHPTLPKPFSFTLREDAEKFMAAIEKEASEEYESCRKNKKNPAKKRRLRPVPLTSKIPLYNKLIAAKEERSRMIRAESALNLLSQVRPFKLECDRRALRALTRSSPELREKKSLSTTSSRFTAKPVPRNLFSTQVYDQMIEDEYFRNVQKRIRAVELLKSASLPPSMARRNRYKSTVSSRSENTTKTSSEGRTPCSGEDFDGDSVAVNRGTPRPSDRSKSSAMTTILPPHGNNLAALLRAQASREKLEREIQQRLEEKRRDQMLRLRKALISRKPAWRALRSAARYEHERDLDIRTSLRRDEAREQAERHRLQMEMMIDRVTQIPTLFERYSQSYRSPMHLCPQLYELKKVEHEFCKRKKKKKKTEPKRQSPSSADSYASLTSSWRPNSGSLTSSSGTPPSIGLSSLSVNSRKFVEMKKKHDRGPLKVSINEKAELIEDKNYDDEDACQEDKENKNVNETENEVKK